MNWKVSYDQDQTFEVIDLIVRDTENAQVYIGITGSPVHRFFTCPFGDDDCQQDTDKCPHCLFWKQMTIVYADDGKQVGAFEAAVLEALKDYPNQKHKVTNIRAGGEQSRHGPMYAYILHNRLEEIYELQLDYHRRALACGYDFFDNPVRRGTFTIAGSPVFFKPI